MVFFSCLCSIVELNPSICCLKLAFWLRQNDRHIIISQTWSLKSNIWYSFLEVKQKYTISSSLLTLLKLCYWELPPPSCLCLTLHHYLDCTCTRSWSGARERPYSLSAETALSNSVSRLRGEHLLPQSYSNYSHHAPAWASATSSIHTATKVNSLAPSKQRPALLCWHSVCANRLHRGWATHKTDWASFTEGNCTGAKWCTFVMRFFPASLKPCLDLFTCRMELLWQGHTISSGKYKYVSPSSRNSHWHWQAIYRLSSLECTPRHEITWHSVVMLFHLVWSGSLKMPRMKALMNVIFRVRLLSSVGFCMLSWLC